MSGEGEETNTAPALIRAVREFHGLNQEAFAHLLRVCRRTVIRMEQRGHYFSTWHWNAQGNTWKDLLARYQAAESLRISSEGFSDRRQVRGAEIVSEITPRIVTRVEWERRKKTRAPTALARKGKGKGNRNVRPTARDAAR